MKEKTHFISVESMIAISDTERNMTPEAIKTAALASIAEMAQRGTLEISVETESLDT